MSTRETADDYDKVVCVLNDRWRVIESSDVDSTAQWILQYCKSASKRIWSADPPYGAFCHFRKTLIRAVAEKAGPCNSNAMQILRSLPTRSDMPKAGP